MALLRFRNLLDNSYTVISRVSPLIYLFLYLAIIPTFALQYTFGTNQTFYAPYAKLEPRATKDIYAFENVLLESVDKNIAHAAQSDGHWKIKPDSVNALLKPGPDTDQMTLTIILGLTRRTPRGREDYDNVPFKTMFSLHPVLALTDPPQICREVVPTGLDPLLGADGPAIFHALFHGTGPCAAGNYVALSPSADRQFLQVVQGLFGDAGKFSGQYWRLLYFSAITITTVGYGDIVPISDDSRLAAALEAILGMVVSGLFLNSVGWRIARAGKRSPCIP